MHDSRCPDPVPRRRVSLKTRWSVWHARFSTAGLVARMDEREAVSVVAAVHGGLSILAIGFFSWIINLPLTFPAIAPSAFILFATPTTDSAAPRSIILGHFSGMASGWAAWHLVSAVVGEPVSIQSGGLAAVVSASLALGVTCGLLIRLSCPHPPACSSSLIIAVGGVTDWLGILVIAVAVVWITLQAVAVNRLAGVRVPTWSPVSRTDSDGT